MEPKNGLYLSTHDFPQWSDDIAPLLSDNNVCLSDEDDMLTKNITFVVTEACNLNCSYCYECHKTNNRMSKEVAKEAVDMLFDKNKINGYYNLDKTKAVIIEFIGGEPLLEIELMDYIVE